MGRWVRAHPVTALGDRKHELISAYRGQRSHSSLSLSKCPTACLSIARVDTEDSDLRTEATPALFEHLSCGPDEDKGP